MAAPASTGSRPAQEDARPRAPGRTDGPDRPRVTLAPWAVVAIWAVLLGLLAALGAGNNALVLEVSGSAGGFVLLLAGAVWLDQRLRPDRGWLRQPTHVGGVFLLAVTAALAWLSLAFGAWLLMIAVVPLIAAAGLEISARRRRRNT